MPIPPIPPDVATRLSAQATQTVGTSAAKGATKMGVSAGRTGARMIIRTGLRILFKLARFIVQWIVIPFAIWTLAKLGLDALSEKMFPHWEMLSRFSHWTDAWWWRVADMINSFIPEWFIWHI